MAATIGLDAVGAASLADELLLEGETLQSVWATSSSSFLTTTPTILPDTEPRSRLSGLVASRHRQDPRKSMPHSLHWRSTSPAATIGRCPPGRANQGGTPPDGGS